MKTNTNHKLKNTPKFAIEQFSEWLNTLYLSPGYKKIIIGITSSAKINKL